VTIADLNEQCPPTRVSAGGHFPAVVFILKKENLGKNAHPTNGLNFPYFSDIDLSVFNF